MSNELDKLEQAFRNEGPILPREEPRKAASTRQQIAGRNQTETIHDFDN